MTSESVLVDAVRSVIDGGLVGSTTSWHAFDYDDVPDPLPANYVLVTLTRRFGDDFRFSFGRQLVGYRLTTLAVGQTVDQARWVRQRVSATLADTSFTLAGQATTYFRFEVEDPIVYDDGRYSGMTTWTFAL